MRIRILGARVIDPSSHFDQLADIFVESGKIVAIGQAPAGFVVEQTIDAQGLVAAPAWSTSTSPCANQVTAAKAASPQKPWPPPLAASPACAARPYQTHTGYPAVAELILDRAREAGHTKVFPSAP